MLKSFFNLRPLITLYCLLGIILGTPTVYAQQDVQEHIQAAQHYMEAEQWDFANYEWRMVLNQNPGHLQANLGLAESLLKSGLAKDAIQQLEAFRQSASSPDVTVMLAHAYKTDGNTALAESLYREVLQEYPFHVKAFAGLYSLVKILPEEQRQPLESFLAECAKNAKQKAKQAVQEQDYVNALSYFRIASIYEHKAGLINDYALVLLFAGENQKAAQQYAILRKQKFNHWMSLANSALVDLSLKQQKRAIKQMEEAIRLCQSPENKSKLYNNLGYILESSNQITRARYAYERAVSYDPGNTKAKMNLAYIYQKTRDYDKAIALYRQILMQDPQNAKVWNYIGFIYELQDKPEKAIDAYQNGIKVNPSFRESYYNLGMLYKKLDKMEKADNAFKRLMDIEFNAVENAQQSAMKAKSEPKLLKFVDVFFTTSPLSS